MNFCLTSTSRRTVCQGALGLGVALPLLSAARMARATDAPTALPDANLLRRRVTAALGPGGPMRAKLESLAATGVVSGVGAVSINDSVLFAQAYGDADRATARPNRLGTRFDVASLGKLFTAVAAGRMLAGGTMTLSDTAGRWIKGLPVDLQPLTVEELLSHTSGMGNYFGSPRYEAVAASGTRVADYLALAIEDSGKLGPRGKYRYANNGYVLLGAMLERAAGKPFDALVKALVFRPSGMIDSAYSLRTETTARDAIGYTKGCFGQPPNLCTPQSEWSAVPRAMRGSPAGGAWSTVPDLLRFASAIETGTLLPRRMLDEMLRPRVASMPQGAPIDAQGLGFGLADLFDTRTFGHNGGTPGFSAQLDMLSGPRVTIAVLTNQDEAQRKMSAVLRRAVFADPAAS